MLKQMTVGKKLGLGFAAVLVLTVVLATLSIVQTRRVDGAVMDLVNIHIPLSAYITELDSEATDQHLQVTLYAVHKEQKQLDNFAKNTQDVDQFFTKIEDILKRDQELVSAGWLDKIQATGDAHDVFVQQCQKFIAVVKDGNDTGTKLRDASDAVAAAYDAFMVKVDDCLALNADETTRVGTMANTTVDASVTWMMVGSILTIVVGTSLAFVIARGITKALRTVIQALGMGSDQVASASAQVSMASQSLAEGATEQAAGLEETSSSLEEMSSMTKQNADNAQQANALAAEAKKAAGAGAEAMERMSQAIQEIQKSSDETSKIIKVIDEIAFQTNLLALNAAVEAARAGEAGKGFAVVAEEVRNLAMRSAEAAKNTASMIEESVKNSKNGVDIATEVSKVLEEIVQSVGKTTDLVSEIAAASQEQAQGVDQVNTAVSQMDKVTQQNAANAEESASASEELNAQAESMKEIVGQLVAMVGGAGSQAAKSNSPKVHVGVEHKLHAASKAGPKSRGFGKSDEVLHKIAGHADKPHAAARSASSVIPLGNDDLKEFNS